MNKKLLIMSAIAGLMRGFGNARQAKNELDFKKSLLGQKQINPDIARYEYYSKLPAGESRKNFERILKLKTPGIGGGGFNYGNTGTSSEIVDVNDI